MQKTVYKYPINPGVNLVSIPEGAELLTVQEQFGNAFLWALVNPDATEETRTIEVFGTGHPIHYGTGSERKYIYLPSSWGTAHWFSMHLNIQVYEKNRTNSRASTQ